MQALQTWEGWHNVLMTWLAAMFFPAAWQLLSLAKRSSDCDSAGRIAAVACLNAGIAPVTMVLLFQVYRGAYISQWLGQEAKLFSDLGWAIGGAAMSIQILPLFVLFFVSYFILGFKRRFCLGFGNVVERGIEWAEERGERSSHRVVRNASSILTFLRLVDKVALGLWWMQRPDCPCSKKRQISASPTDLARLSKTETAEPVTAGS